jgi:hypothetical protein
MHNKEDFWPNVAVLDTTMCWPWMRSCNSTGYGTLQWSGKPAVAHRVAAFLSGLVLSPFAPLNRKKSGFVLHTCDNKLCCNPAHMEVGTYSKNQSDAYNRNLRAAFRGDTHKNAKLTKQQAAEIRAAYKPGVRQVDLAQQYGVSQRCVSLVVRGETYA